jgi:hypothetical protein
VTRLKDPGKPARARQDPVGINGSRLSSNDHGANRHVDPEHNDPATITVEWPEVPMRLLLPNILRTVFVLVDAMADPRGLPYRGFRLAAHTP